jgi:hypothetical protein
MYGTARKLIVGLIATGIGVASGIASAASFDCRVYDNQASDPRDNTIVDLPIEALTLAAAEQQAREIVAADPDNPSDLGVDCRLVEE